MSVTLYETMLTDRGVTPTELKAQWRRLARELHPDRFVKSSLKVQAAAASRFAEVSAAYATLSDAKRRAAYDAQLDLLTDPCRACRGTGRVWSQEGFAKKTAKTCRACSGSGRVQRPS